MPQAKLIAWSAASTLAWAAASAAAQSPPPIVQHTETVALPPPIDNQVSVSITAGGTLNAGNTQSYAANAGGHLGLIRASHQLSLELLATMAWARPNADAEVEATAKNIFGRARYDYFLSNSDALFVAVQPRRDTFAGLDLRLQNQIGYLRTLYRPRDGLRLWSELGYDFTYDNFDRIRTTETVDRTSEFEDLPPNYTVTESVASSLQPKDDLVHSARIFLGYTNMLNPLFTINLGAETLLDFEAAKNVRVNGLAQVTTSLNERLKLALQSRVLFDNVPVADKEKLDTVLAAQLVYTFESSAPQAAPCDCSAEVAAAKAACRPCNETPSPPPVPEAPEELSAPDSKSP